VDLHPTPVKEIVFLGGVVQHGRAGDRVAIVVEFLCFFLFYYFVLVLCRGLGCGFFGCFFLALRQGFLEVRY